MPRSSRREEHRRRALRESVFELFTGAGTLLGIWWMVQTWGEQPSAECAPGTPTGECTADTLLAGLIPALTKIGIGLMAGAFLAVVIVSIVPGLKRSSRRS